MVIENDRGEPIESTLSTIDKGDDSLRRFRYQISYTSIIVIEMYEKLKPYEKIWCEHHEDILIKLNDNTYYGIQIKTKEWGSLKLSDQIVIDSFSRFVELEKSFPNKFHKFILVGNNFHEENTGTNINLLIKEIKEVENRLNGYSANTEKYLKKIEGEIDFIVKALKKVECRKGPSLEDIDAVVIRDFLNHAKECKRLIPHQIEQLYSDLIQLIFNASSKNSLSKYVYTLISEDNTVPSEIKVKLITRERISPLFDRYKPEFYLQSRSKTLANSKNGTVEKFERKMLDASIDPSVIENMIDLITTAEYSIFESSQVDPENTIKSRIDDLEVKLKTVYSESKTRLESKRGTRDYGKQLLQLIENELHRIVTYEPNTVFCQSYYVLKGYLGILIRECDISLA